MNKTLEYNGHTITVDAHQVARGWQWSYQIDGGPVRTGKDRPLRSEEVMRTEAIDIARIAIDNLKPR